MNENTDSDNNKEHLCTTIQIVVDVHGHMTTPAVFRQFLAETVSQNTPNRKLEMTDEQLETAQQRHLKFMDDRNIDIQLIGPRPIAMWHWMRPFLQEFWAARPTM